MADEDDPTSLDDLKVRVNKARQALGGGDGPASDGTGNALSVAFRMGIELFAGLGVGIGIGWWLDNWLDSGPLFLVIFFALGAAAGILGVMRAARQGQVGAGDDQDGLGDDQDRLGDDKSST